MALGIYKPGQGYWVRVLTAAGIGILTAAAAVWTYKQMAVVAERLPRVAYQSQVSADDAAPKAGDELQFVGKPPQPGVDGPLLGTAKVSSWSPESRTVTFKDFLPTADNRTGGGPEQASELRGPAYRAPIAPGSITPQYAVPQGLVQSGAASLVLALGAALAYYLCALRPRFVDFLIATDLEMKKVHWSNWKDIRAQTFVVIGASLSLAAFLFFADFAFQAFFSAIGIIQT